MVYVYTLFDYSVRPPEPLAAITYDKKAEFHIFYLRGTGLNIKEIRENLEKFKLYFRSDFFVNDFKTHLKAFDLGLFADYRAYDWCSPKLNYKPKSLLEAKKILVTSLGEMMSDEPKRWQQLIANSSAVYEFLGRTGILHFRNQMFPYYDLDTFSGRSRCLDFNVQGLGEDEEVHHVAGRNNIFVHFDWISADLIMAAFLSQDKDLNKSFRESDPYTYLSGVLGIPRPEAKNALLRSLYSLSVDDAAMQAFPTFREWTKSRIKDMSQNGFLSTVMGRRFFVENNNELGVFNAQFQGSVAHAMQSTLIRVYEQYAQFLLTEVHDCVVFCCPEQMVPKLIRDVTPVMLDPLIGWIKPSPRMPLTVSVGESWKKWTKYRVFR